MASSTSPPPLEDCLDIMDEYVAECLKIAGWTALPTHLIVCAADPTEKIIVSIVDQEQFDHLNRENDQVMVDDDYEVEMYWQAREKMDKAKSPPKSESREAREKREKEEKMTKEILDFNILSKPRPVQSIGFNGIQYEVLMKEGPKDEDCWCNAEKFCKLFKVQGTRGQKVEDAETGEMVWKHVPNVIAKDSIFVVDLIKVAKENAAAKAKEVWREKKKQAKKDRKKAQKLAGKEAAKATEEKAVTEEETEEEAEKLAKQMAKLEADETAAKEPAPSFFDSRKSSETVPSSFFDSRKSSETVPQPQHAM